MTNPKDDYEQRYNTLYQQLIARGATPEEAEARAAKRIGEIRLADETARRGELLENISDEVKQKVIFWRNNAFPNKEIVQKLVEKYDYSEEDAKKVVSSIQAEQIVEEQATIKEVEEKKQHNYNVIMGAFLLIGGLLGGLLLVFVAEDTDLADYYIYLFGVAIAGLVQLVAGLRKREYHSDL